MSNATDLINQIKAADPNEARDIAEGNATRVEREVIDQTRWAVVVRYIFKCDDDTHFALELDEPATEMQDSYVESVEAYPVTAQQVMVTRWVKDQ